MWEVNTKAIIVSWRTSTRSFFCDGEISAGVPTHIITCNCNNRVVYIHPSLHPSFLQVNRYYGISQHFFDNWVMIFLQSYMIIPSSLLPETDNKSMTSKLWPKQWSLLSKKIELWSLSREFLKQYLDEKKTVIYKVGILIRGSLISSDHSERVYYIILIYRVKLYISLIKQQYQHLTSFIFVSIFFKFKFRFLFILFHLLFLMGRGLICDSVKKKKNKIIIITCTS